MNGTKMVSRTGFAFPLFIHRFSRSCFGMNLYFRLQEMTMRELCESKTRRSSGDKRRAIGWRRISKAALTLHFKRGEARAEFSRLGDSRRPNLVLQADRWLVANMV